MTNKIIEKIKEAVHGMSNAEIIKAYKEFTGSGDTSRSAPRGVQTVRACTRT